MKVLDVHSLQAGIDNAVLDIDTTRDQISAIQRAIRDFYGLDDVLKGETGNAVRSFFNDCHQPFLIFLYQSLVDYKNTLTGMKEAIDSYESNSKGFVSQHFVENDVEEGLNQIEKKTNELTDKANSIIESVLDIVSLEKIDDSEVMESIRRGKRQAENVVEELHILDEYETSCLEQTKEDLQTMKSYLSEIESKFKSADLSVQSYRVDALKGIDAYNLITDSIYNKNAAETKTLNKKSIESMPLSEIEKFKDETSKGLSDDGKKLLNLAFHDLENGVIDRQEYLETINGLQKFEKDIKEGNTHAEVDPTFLQYFAANYKNIGVNVYSDVMIASIKQIGKQAVEIGDIVKGYPIGKNFFSKLGEFIVRRGRNIQGAGTALGIGTMTAGFFIGYHDDRVNNNKTPGEAIAHNSASLGVGLTLNAGGAIATTQALSLLGGTVLVSNPAGWAVLGGIAAGTLATTGFNFLYERNMLGLQDKLDSVGQKLDEFGEVAKETFNNTLDSVGEAINCGLDAINPMNWGWW